MDCWCSSFAGLLLVGGDVEPWDDVVMNSCCSLLVTSSQAGRSQSSPIILLISIKGEDPTRLDGMACFSLEAELWGMASLLPTVPAAAGAWKEVSFDDEEETSVSLWLLLLLLLLLLLMVHHPS